MRSAPWRTTAIARRTRRARFEQTVTFEGSDYTAASKLPAAQIATWPRCAGCTPPSR
jgi:hypothetical protein